MQLMESAEMREYIPVTAELVPCTLDIKLVDKTYRMMFEYNEIGDFFTVTLSIPVPSNELLCYSEIIRYGKTLFEQFNDERYPLPLIIPACATGDEIEKITYENFGTTVRLWLVDRV